MNNLLSEPTDPTKLMPFWKCLLVACMAGLITHFLHL